MGILFQSGTAGVSVFSADCSCTRGEGRDSSPVAGVWKRSVESGCVAYGLGDGWWEVGRDGRYIGFEGSCEEEEEACDSELDDGRVDGLDEDEGTFAGDREPSYGAGDGDGAADIGGEGPPGP